MNESNTVMITTAHRKVQGMRWTFSFFLLVASDVGAWWLEKRTTIPPSPPVHQQGKDDGRRNMLTTAATATPSLPRQNPSRREVLLDSTASSVLLVFGQQHQPSWAAFAAPPDTVDAAAKSSTTFAPKSSIDSSSPSPLVKVKDPMTFSALSYAPPVKDGAMGAAPPPPLLLVLHGAGRNAVDDVREELASAWGEHSTLIPALIESGKAPDALLDEFAVLAPYSGKGTSSFYELPRSSIIRFLDWAASDAGRSAGCPAFDPSRVVIFGFSDGATVAVELLTTGRFRAGVVCAYGYSGSKLPDAALDRLAGVPVWVFHSQDDAIFDVGNSDRLVRQLRERSQAAATPSSEIRYSRYRQDPEGLTGPIRGHVSMGIVASNSKEVYEWALAQVGDGDGNSEAVDSEATAQRHANDRYDGSVP